MATITSNPGRLRFLRQAWVRTGLSALLMLMLFVQNLGRSGMLGVAGWVCLAMAVPLAVVTIGLFAVRND